MPRNNGVSNFLGGGAIHIVGETLPPLASPPNYAIGGRFSLLFSVNQRLLSQPLSFYHIAIKGDFDET